jgi:O-antigen ligase
MALLVLPFTAVTGAIASSSRGALLGMAAVGLWMLARSKYKVRGTIALLVFGALAYMLIPEQQRARLSASGEDATSTSRLVYWERGIEFANDYPLLGIGYANWLPYYTRVWESRLGEGERIQLPHNLFIEAWSELGYTGLTALLFLIFGTFYLNSRTRALAQRLGNKGFLSHQLAWGFDGGLVGYLVSGFFVTVLYYPYLWVNLGMAVALHLSVARAHRAAQRVRAR